MNKTFKVLEGEKDVALVHYAEDRLLNSKCDWQDGALDHILRFYKKPKMRVAIDGGDRDWETKATSFSSSKTLNVLFIIYIPLILGILF